VLEITVDTSTAEDKKNAKNVQNCNDIVENNDAGDNKQRAFCIVSNGVGSATDYRLNAEKATTVCNKLTSPFRSISVGILQESSVNL